MRALAAWESAGGYRAEVLWDRCAHEAFGGGFPESADRPIETLSGGERKRLALEIVFRSSFDVVLLDEPDNTLDIEGKEWLEARIIQDPRTILFISHDRTVLERAATHIVTLEGRATWTHPGGFATYAAARDARVDRLDERHRRYEEERKRLEDMIKEMKRKAAYNDGWASKARAAEHRLERFEDREQPPEKAEVQQVRMRVDGGRTGKVAFSARAGHRGHHRPVRRRGAFRRTDRRDQSTAPASRISCVCSPARRSRTTASGCSARGSTPPCSRSSTSGPTSAIARSSRS
jgi:ATPase subunit of ABC transporter with duplicated ATPase domains